MKCGVFFTLWSDIALENLVRCYLRMPIFHYSNLVCDLVAGFEQNVADVVSNFVSAPYLVIDEVRVMAYGR